MRVSGGAVTTLMIGTTVANGWGTGVGTEGGGELVATTPTGSGREEGGDATTGRDGDAEGRVTKETVDGVTLGWKEEEGPERGRGVGRKENERRGKNVDEAEDG